MCRFIAYTGEPIVIEDLLFRPKNSLILQSYKAREREEPLNGDGFGLGWYNHEVDPTAAVFRSVTPAWSNMNLQELARRTRSGCFFGHVRAATHGTPVLEVNCHPFSYGRLLWMHNGHLGGFPVLKRKLINLLSDQAYQSIQGSTDSEHLFALFLDALQRPQGQVSPEELKVGLFRMLETVDRLRVENGVTESSYLNICVTNGEEVIAMRYVSDNEREPHSLYHSRDGKHQSANGGVQVIERVLSDRGVIVSSERLTDRREDWMPIPRNHVAVLGRNLSTTIQAIER